LPQFLGRDDHPGSGSETGIGGQQQLGGDQKHDVPFQASPHYPGGLALRFARVKRYRPDKRAEDADTIETVRAIHERPLNSEC
jgi:hypothetical protein